MCARAEAVRGWTRFERGVGGRDVARPQRLLGGGDLVERARQGVARGERVPREEPDAHDERDREQDEAPAEPRRPAPPTAGVARRASRSVVVMPLSVGAGDGRIGAVAGEVRVNRGACKERAPRHTERLTARPADEEPP